MGALVERWENSSICEQLKYQRSPSEREQSMFDPFVGPAKTTFRENVCEPSGIQTLNRELLNYRIA